MNYNLMKKSCALWLIALHSLVTLTACNHLPKHDNEKLAIRGLPAIEKDMRYMKCEDFSLTNKQKESIDSSSESAEISKTEKIIILYSAEGSGHKSAAEAVARALRDSEEKILGKGRTFAIAQVDILYDLLPKTELYDEYLKAEKWDKLKSLVSYQGVAEKMISARQMVWDNKVLNRIMRACDNRAPSMIISVFPVGNYVYANIAKKNNIPMLIVPTDYEVSHFVNKIDESTSEQANVFLGLSVAQPEVITPLHPNNAAKPVVPYCIVGYPVRKEFSELRTKIDAAGKSKEAPEVLNYRSTVLKIPKGAKSILITLGGKGGALELLLQYVQHFHAMQMNSSLGAPLHVFIASGGDKTIIEGFIKKASTFADNILFKSKVLGRLDAAHMALTMASVDAVLLKPGGSTIGEALTLGTPIIIKSDSTLALPWEKTNMELVKRMGWGIDLIPATSLQVDANDLILKVKKMLASSPRRSLPPFINFQNEFPKLMKALLHAKGDKLSTTVTAPLMCVQ